MVEEKLSLAQIETLQKLDALKLDNLQNVRTHVDAKRQELYKNLLELHRPQYDQMLIIQEALSAQCRMLEQNRHLQSEASQSLHRIQHSVSNSAIALKKNQDKLQIVRAVIQMKKTDE
ncbi:hypothetical protein MP228_002231 [Amoeboaphelidium protococcarum]|nr:hypothetical protein MP228_002231 [Amoeboaphelidium protococcarum]